MAAVYLAPLMVGRWQQRTSPLLLLADVSSVPRHSYGWQMAAENLATLIAGRCQQCNSAFVIRSSLPRHSNCWQRRAVYKYQALSPAEVLHGHSFCWQMAAVYLATLIVGRWQQCISPLLLLAVVYLPPILPSDGSSVLIHSFCWPIATVYLQSLLLADGSSVQVWCVHTPQGMMDKVLKLASPS
jgi:hypothetical protein